MLIAIMRAQDKLSLLMATSQPWNDPLLLRLPCGHQLTRPRQSLLPILASLPHLALPCPWPLITFVVNFVTTKKRQWRQQKR